MKPKLQASVTTSWTPIQYRELWDVPRIFLVDHERLHFLFDCPFDEQTEDYSGSYKVYLLPDVTEEEVSGSWHQLPQRAIRFVKQIPVAEVCFDPTQQKAIATQLLEELSDLVRSPEHAG